MLNLSAQRETGEMIITGLTEASSLHRVQTAIILLRVSQ